MQASQLEIPDKVSVAIQSCLEAEFLFKVLQSFPLRPSTDWMRPTLLEGNLFYSKSTDLNVNHI